MCIRDRANALGIERIKMNKQYGRLYFHLSTKVETDQLLKLIESNGDKFRLYPDQSLGFKVENSEDKKRLDEIRVMLDYLANDQVLETTH